MQSGFRPAHHNLESFEHTRVASDYRISLKYDMAQSANKPTTLRIDAFWDKPTPDQPRRREKWRVQYKLALLSNENIILDTLL